MRKFVKNFFVIIFLAGYAPAAVSNLQGAESGKIGVENITARLQNDTLKVSAEFVNLFSKRIIGTIQSGLPSIIQIEIKLIGSNRKQIARKFISKSIEYDIWEEKYQIIRNGKTKMFSDFAAMRAVGARLQNEKLFFRRDKRNGKTYSIQIRVGIIPISSSQAEKVTDWLMDPNQTEEKVASDNRTTGFELNVNKLISFFVTKKKGSKYVSKWYSSKPFHWNELVR